MPKYITRPDDYELSLPPIYTQKGANVRAYLMTGDYFKMQATVKRYLNDVTPSGTYYTPLGNAVVATFMAIKEVRCNIKELGYMHEVDCAFFIPLIRWQWGIPQDIAFFAPYMFVNNSWAMATGREVHGFRKDVAHSFSALDVNDYDVWSHLGKDLRFIDAWAMKTRASDTRLSIQRLVEVNGPFESGSSGALIDPFMTLVKGIIGDLSPFAASLSALPLPAGVASWIDVIASAVIAKMTTTDAEGEAAVRLPIAFLRQFRDPTSSDQADVQQVIEADMTSPFASMSASIPTGEFQLKFFPKASHPIAEELGLSETEDSKLTIDANLDFTLMTA